jgi:Na+/proline symporter
MTCEKWRLLLEIWYAVWFILLITNLAFATWNGLISDFFGSDDEKKVAKKRTTIIATAILISLVMLFTTFVFGHIQYPGSLFCTYKESINYPNKQ